MLVGYQPFFDDNPFLIAEKILTEDIKWPRKMDSVAKDLIENLLERDRTKRLGSTGGGAEDVKNHRYTILSEHTNHHHHPNIFQIFQNHQLGRCLP